ncbi:MAG: hypothetical protein U1E65_09635 [Myxococcota bacterium]
MDVLGHLGGFLGGAGAALLLFIDFKQPSVPVGAKTKALALGALSIVTIALIAGPIEVYRLGKNGAAHLLAERAAKPDGVQFPYLQNSAAWELVKEAERQRATSNSRSQWPRPTRNPPQRTAATADAHHP